MRNAPNNPGHLYAEQQSVQDSWAIGAIIIGIWLKVRCEFMERERVVRAFSDYPILFKGIKSELDMFDILKRGLPVKSLSAIESRGIVSSAELRNFIPSRTMARRKSQGRFTSEESDLLARLGRIYEFAVEVFGKKAKAGKWLRTPNRALRNYRPLDLLATDYGARIVESILGRIQHGIFS